MDSSVVAADGWNLFADSPPCKRAKYAKIAEWPWNADPCGDEYDPVEGSREIGGGILSPFVITDKSSDAFSICLSNERLRPV